MTTKKLMCTALSALMPVQLEQISIMPAGRGSVRALGHHLLLMCPHPSIHSFIQHSPSTNYVVWLCAGCGDTLGTTQAQSGVVPRMWP